MKSSKHLFTRLLALSSLILSLASTCVQAQETHEDIRYLEAHLRFHRVLAQVGRTFPSHVNDRTGARYLRAATERATLAALNLVKDQQNTKTIDSILNRIRWSAILEHVKEIKAKVQSTTRLQGYAAGASVAVGFAGEIVVPLVFGALRMPEAIAISELFPMPIIFPAVTGAFMQLRYRQELIRIYGGPEEYNAIRKAQEVSRQRLGLRHVTDFLIPIAETRDSDIFVVGSNPGIFRRMLERMHLAPRSINPISLLQFAEEQHWSNDYLASLSRAKGISGEIRTTLMLQHILRDHGFMGAIALQQQFKDRVVEIEIQSLALSREIYNWAHRARLVHSWAELKSVLREIPADTPAIQVIHLFKEGLLPELAMNLEEASAGQFQYLVKQMQRLVADADRHPEDLWNASWSQRLLNSVQSAINLKPCEEPLEKPLEGEQT